MASNEAWEKIFADYNILRHNFAKAPFILSNRQIKESCQHFTRTSQKEVRILCKQDSRKSRPEIFKKHGLFILPVKNGTFAIIKGEGYVDIPEIESKIRRYRSKLAFHLDTSEVGNSEMQHLDYAYATSLIRNFIGDPSLLLTVRGRKRASEQFSFQAGKHNNTLDVKGVQVEVDAGYEGRNRVVLVEAKNSTTGDVIIRQLYYPLRQWRRHTRKPIELLFFEKRNLDYCLWRFAFDDVYRYNSIRLLDSARYRIQSRPKKTGK